ncbi:FadR/GntR family transcriptional regulator [Cytobacillus sp. Hm23]
MSSRSKVYIEIVHQLQCIITEDRLKAGDKIPSERELAVRLKAGRSSVREALRALELLGIIETRQGEGTFIKEFGDHSLIELIGSFILQDDKAKEDILETKYLLERNSIFLCCKVSNKSYLQCLKSLTSGNNFDHDQFMKTVVEATNNRLLLRIWLVLFDYYKLEYHSYNLPLDYYTELINALEEEKVDLALSIYESIAVKQLSIDA